MILLGPRGNQFEKSVFGKETKKKEKLPVSTICSAQLQQGVIAAARSSCVDVEGVSRQR